MLEKIKILEEAYYQPMHDTVVLITKNLLHLNDFSDKLFTDIQDAKNELERIWIPEKRDRDLSIRNSSLDRLINKFEGTEKGKYFHRFRYRRIEPKDKPGLTIFDMIDNFPNKLYIAVEAANILVVTDLYNRYDPELIDIKHIDITIKRLEQQINQYIEGIKIAEDKYGTELIDPYFQHRKIMIAKYMVDHLKH
ncbi:MAG: hypothetical protein R3B64_02590 [Candidatus Paceibacterota bacterium]